MSARAHRRALAHRDSRRAAYDRLSPTDQKGRKRPGSLNPKGGRK